MFQKTTFTTCLGVGLWIGALAGRASASPPAKPRRSRIAQVGGGGRRRGQQPLRN